MKNSTITRRKSIRKYDMTPLDDATLSRVKELIASVTPLYPEIQYSIDIVPTIKGMLGVKAPHYLIFGSEKTENAAENIGFIGQQIDLGLSAMGIGACWLGMAKPGEMPSGALPHVICIAFGRPDEPLYRDPLDFKRKTLGEMSEGNDDRLEAARLAPSGVNLQGWYFIAEDNLIHCYRKKPNPLAKRMFGELGKIDLGIAICHIFEESDRFAYEFMGTAPLKKGYIYAGTVTEGVR